MDSSFTVAGSERVEVLPERLPAEILLRDGVQDAEEAPFACPMAPLDDGRG